VEHCGLQDRRQVFGDELAALEVDDARDEMI